MPMPPPPPGPPPPGPPPPPVFNPISGKSKGGAADNRGALLQSIRQGTKLKKAVTNDKSAPVISGRVAGSSNSNSDTGRFGSIQSSSSNISSQPLTNGLGLGGLFAGGMPKLRPTGRAIGSSQPSLNITNTVVENTRKASPEPARQNVGTSSTSSQLSEVLRKQLAGDIRNRGPPPQPPTSRSNIVTDSSDSSNIPPSRSPFISKNISESSSPLAVNKNTLHQSKSNSSFLHANATSITATNTGHVSNNNAASKPAISHGKPNLAPKPPAIAPSNKPATPPKKLVMNGRVPVSRAQSMRVPRSPPVAPPVNPPFPPTLNGKDFGTIRGIPTAFHQSQENLSVRQTHNSRTLPVNLLKSTAPTPPSLNNRPLAPPPNRPPAPPPPSRTGSNMNLKAPLSPPPPPPISMPPPPPPHRTSPAPPPPPPSHTRPPPAIPLNGPPPPPVRNSSMRNGSSNAVSPSLDFDTRFSNLFHPISDFPPPSIFRGLNKMYNSKSVVNKQQAPLPPNTIHLGTKLSESSTC